MRGIGRKRGKEEKEGGGFHFRKCTSEGGFVRPSGSVLRRLRSRSQRPRPKSPWSRSGSDRPEGRIWARMGLEGDEALGKGRGCINGKT